MTINFVDDLGFDETNTNAFYINPVNGPQIYPTGAVKFDDHGVYAYETQTGPVDVLTFVPWSNVKNIVQYQ